MLIKWINFGRSIEVTHAPSGDKAQIQVKRGRTERETLLRITGDPSLFRFRGMEPGEHFGANSVISTSDVKETG